MPVRIHKSLVCSLNRVCARAIYAGVGSFVTRSADSLHSIEMEGNIVDNNNKHHTREYINKDRMAS